MEKVKKLILIIILVLVLTGCGSKNINQEMSKLKEEMANIQKEVEDINKEDLLKQIQSKNEKIETLEKELTTAKQQIDQLYKDNNAKNNFTENLKMTVTDNNKKIEELTRNNLALTNKVSSLETTNKTLNSTISYIKNNQSSNSKYTITKEQLVGKWQEKDGNYIYEFTENSEVIDNNWFILEIIYEDSDQSIFGMPYLYKDGILYVPEGVLVKID